MVGSATSKRMSVGIAVFPVTILDYGWSDVQLQRECVRTLWSWVCAMYTASCRVLKFFGFGTPVHGVISRKTGA